MTDMPMKTCTKCDKVFPATVEFFSRRKGTKDGLYSWCKACQSVSNRQYNLANKQKILDQKRQYYQENKDVIVERRLNHNKDVERTKVTKREWQRANPDKSAVSRHKYYLANKDKYRIYKVNRRARVNSLPNTFTSDDWQRALSYFNGCCAVCGRQLHDLFSTHTAGADHWIPLSYEGADNPGTVATNIVPLCHGVNGCNESKFNKLPTLWLTERYGTRKANIILARVQEYFAWVLSQTNQEGKSA